MPPRLTRREVLAGMAVSGAALAVGCTPGGGGDAEDAATTTTRSGPAYLTGQPPGGELLPPGTRPDPSRPEGTDLLPQIDHIVVLMMENHSYDNYLGMLGRGDGFDLDADGRPTNSNPDLDGKAVPVFHLDKTLPEGDQTQTWSASHKQWDNGTNEGFVKAGGSGAMGYFDGTDLPFYYGLAGTFPLCDRYFCSVPAQTYPNRRFLQAGTAYGLLTTTLPSMTTQPPPNGTIYTRLNELGKSWHNYYGLIPDCALFPSVFLTNQDKTSKMDTFFDDAASGDLSSFNMLTCHIDIDEEDNDITEGEAFMANVVDAVMSGPGWDKTIFVWCYDEHGGYYDHVVPPEAIPPDDVEPDLGPDDPPGHYDRYGPRVPASVISPFSRPDYVSSIVYDHTSVLRLVETKWNVGAFTYRDANAANLLDCVDLSTPPAFATPPELPAPKHPRPPKESWLPPSGVAPRRR